MIYSFVLAGNGSQAESWNEAERAAEALLDYKKDELQQIRRELVDEFCETKEGVAFLLQHIQETNKISSRQYGYLAEALGTARMFFTTSGPHSLTGFTRWLEDMLEGNIPHLAQQMTAWLPDNVGHLTMGEQQKHDFVRTVAHALVDDLQHIGEQTFPRNADSRSEEQHEQFGRGAEETRLLDLLFEHGFLPTYAFPREVRSFVIEEWKHGNGGIRRIGIKQRPQQSVDIALSEYAPGRELIVDKVTYRVNGIYIDPFPGLAFRLIFPLTYYQQPPPELKKLLQGPMMGFLPCWSHLHANANSAKN